MQTELEISNQLEMDNQTMNVNKWRKRIGCISIIAGVVLVTITLTTSGLALIPLALKGDEPGSEIQSPMAVVILGGLLSATILNLVVIPCVYQLMIKKSIFSGFLGGVMASMCCLGPTLLVLVGLGALFGISGLVILKVFFDDSLSNL